jgi:hypothetical protein
LDILAASKPLIGIAFGGVADFHAIFEDGVGFNKVKDMECGFAYFGVDGFEEEPLCAFGGIDISGAE